MAALSTTLGVAAIAGGLGMGAYAMGQNQGKSKFGDLIRQVLPKDQAQPLQAPTPESSEEAARQEMTLKKRMRALSGGKTLLTQEGYSTGAGTGAKTLLGA